MTDGQMVLSFIWFVLISLKKNMSSKSFGSKKKKNEISNEKTKSEPIKKKQNNTLKEGLFLYIPFSFSYIFFIHCNSRAETYMEKGQRLFLFSQTCLYIFFFIFFQIE